MHVWLALRIFKSGSRSDGVMRSQPNETYSSTKNESVCDVSFGTYEFHRDEGRNKGLDPDAWKNLPGAKVHFDHTISSLLQNNIYDFEMKKQEATSTLSNGSNSLDVC